jgi:hypothetical protein
VSVHDYLKGNYDLAPAPGATDAPAAPAAPAAASLEEEFERQALQKLGGSIAFIKKSKSFVWKGPARDRAR